jgi:hypothetical protein
VPTLVVGLDWIYGSATIKYSFGAIAMVTEQSGAVMTILFFTCSKSNNYLLSVDNEAVFHFAPVHPYSIESAMNIFVNNLPVL